MKNQRIDCKKFPMTFQELKMHGLEKLASRPWLWSAFILSVLITAAFRPIADHFELTLLDRISDPDEVRAAIEEMTQAQRTAHAWVTGTLDIAYPLAYGALFAGSALCFFPKRGRKLAPLLLLAIPVDLAEGLVQVLALNGWSDWTISKAVLTPLKMILFLGGALVMLCGWAVWVRRRVGKRNSTTT